MRRFSAALLACAMTVGLVASSLFATALPADAATTGKNAAQTGRIVSTTPSANTPGVMDGEVLSLAKVGNWIVVGGTFTTVRNPGSSTDIKRKNVFAFSATTGQVSTTFAPNPNKSVNKVLPSADGQVFLGGDFTLIKVGSQVLTVSRLIKLNVTTGALNATFKPGTYDGAIRDLEVTGGRLWVAGKFTKVQGRTQRALGTINATTGAYDPFFTGVLSGIFNPAVTSATTSVLALSTDPSNGQLVAVGNFTKLDGLVRSQIIKLDIGGSKYKIAPWYTKLFEPKCTSQKFEAYVSDVSFSPDGSYFVVATTGSYGGLAPSNAGTTGCDVVTRFEGGVTGLKTPTWTNYTGGDTTWTIEVTDKVIYAGGHQKFQNNPGGYNVAGPGAVSRPGIAALNPVNGLPYSWNPTRTRGVGVKDMLATDDGLYVGSDTSTFAGQTRYRIAYLPLSGGKTLPDITASTLPGEVFRVRSTETRMIRSTLTATGVSSNAVDVSGDPDWGTVTGAFMINNKLYTAYADGRFTQRDFDGKSYGYETNVDTADKVLRQDDWHDTDIPSMTSLWYSAGRIYYTRSGANVLYSRAFEPESDVVGQQRLTTAAVSGISYANMRGAFVADGKLYYGNANGTLAVATWSGSAPVAGTAKTLFGAGMRWSNRALFPFNGSDLADVDVPPTAQATASCTAQTCTFDASGSSDEDGEIVSYTWAFGDGQTGEGKTTSHTYATSGTQTATVTVTDNEGETAEKSVTVEVN